MPRKRLTSQLCESCGRRLTGLWATENPDQKVCTECVPHIAPSLVPLQHDRDRTSKILERSYGITAGQFERLLIQQGGRCAICRQFEAARGPDGQRQRLAVDHDHASGEVRGLLCGTCNRALGLFKDDGIALARAIVYLADPPAQRVSQLRRENTA